MVCIQPWPLSSDPPPLNPGEVHLWSASLLTSKEKLLEFESCLDEREQARAERFTIERSRTRFIVARATLKHLLAKYTGDDPTTIRFHLGPLGKPYLPPASGCKLHFNSTDTQDEALFAFCQGAEIGVDIEYKSRTINHSKIAARICTAQEFAHYAACPPELRQLNALSLWTRKEAYGKAIGRGIKYKLSKVNLVDREKSSRLLLRDEVGMEWEVVQTEPTDELLACVVVQGGGWRFRCQRLIQDPIRCESSISPIQPSRE